MKYMISFHPLKGTVSQHNFCSIFLINHILLFSQRYSTRILNFDEVSWCFIQPKRKLACLGYTGESGLPDVAYAGEYRSPVWPSRCRIHRQVWTPRCSLHWGVQITGVAYTGESTQILFSLKLTGVGYTGESRLNGVGNNRRVWTHHDVGYTGESKLTSVAYTGESIVQPSRPTTPLNGTISSRTRL